MDYSWLKKKIFISPPFGNYLNATWATSIAGSYTAERRRGLVCQTIKTLRPISGGWVNRIGLRNPGIKNIKFDQRKIYSIAALHEEDYGIFLEHIPKETRIEINLGCPNVDSEPVLGPVKLFVDKHPFVSVKLPPYCVPNSRDFAWYSYEQGVRWFHACNTIPTERGGESGDRLREQSLEMIDWMRKNMPSNITIIGGGGIYHPDHVTQYFNAGATAISLSTVWFTPWKISDIYVSYLVNWIG